MIVRFFGMCMDVERKCNKSCGLDVKCLHNLMFEHLVVDGGTVWEDYGAWLEEVCHGGGAGLSGFGDRPHFLFRLCFLTAKQPHTPPDMPSRP